MKRLFLILATLVLWAIPSSLRAADPARSVTPAPSAFLTEAQILNRAFDAISKSLSVTATVGLPGTPAAQFFTSDQILNQVFDPATNSLKMLCISGCTGGDFPRLDQILDLAVDKTFDFSTYSVIFKSNIGAVPTGFLEPNHSVLAVGNFGAVGTGSSYTGLQSESHVVEDITENGSSAEAIVARASVGSVSATTGIDGFGLLAKVSNTGTANYTGDLFGILTQASPDTSGTSEHVGGIYIDGNSVNKRTKNNYGLRIYTQEGGINNYSIKTLLGPVDIGDRITGKSNPARRQPVTFTGAGLDDATSGGAYTALDDLAYCVQIDASVPSPDTFEWGTGGSCSNGATGVNITGAAQNLSNGVQITFAAIDGHTIGNNWTFTAYAPIPLTLQDSSGNITFRVYETGVVAPGITTLAVGAAYGDGKHFECANCDTPLTEGAVCSTGGDGAGAHAQNVRGATRCF